VYGRSNALRGTIQRDVISCVATKLELSSYFELAGLTFLDQISESSSNTPLSMASNDQCCAAQGSMGPCPVSDELFAKENSFIFNM